MAEGLAWGDIRLIELGPPDKRRPALLLSRTALMAHLSTLVVAPITRTIRDIPSEVRLGPESGLKEESVAKLDQLQSVSRERVGRYVGGLDPARKKEVREALLFALELDGLE